MCTPGPESRGESPRTAAQLTAGLVSLPVPELGALRDPQDGWLPGPTRGWSLSRTPPGSPPSRHRGSSGPWGGSSRWTSFSLCQPPSPTHCWWGPRGGLSKSATSSARRWGGAHCPAGGHAHGSPRRKRVRPAGAHVRQLGTQTQGETDRLVSPSPSPSPRAACTEPLAPRRPPAAPGHTPGPESSASRFRPQAPETVPGAGTVVISSLAGQMEAGQDSGHLFVLSRTAKTVPPGSGRTRLPAPAEPGVSAQAAHPQQPRRPGHRGQPS